MFTIGTHQFNSQVLLAPMAGTSDKPFRMLAKNFGAALATSEMVLLKDGLLNSQKSQYRLNFTEEASPISLQIAGTTPDEMVEYAKKARDFGADIIDINMGCPAKKVCKKDSGSALMRDEKLVAKILENVVKSVDIPITLKTRTGWDRQHKNALTIAKIAQESGVQMLTIHGRTRTDKYSGEAEYNTIQEVVASIDIPVVANGDIDSGKKAKYVLEKTKASAVMLGRITQGQPWIIWQINQFLRTGKWLEFDNKQAIILQHIEEIYSFYPEKVAGNIAKKHIKWYLQAANLQHHWQEIHTITNEHQRYQKLSTILSSTEL